MISPLKRITQKLQLLKTDTDLMVHNQFQKENVSFVERIFMPFPKSYNIGAEENASFLHFDMQLNCLNDDQKLE